MVMSHLTIVLHMCLQDYNDFLAGNMLRSATRFRALDETALFGSACRHEFPAVFLNLKHGEKYIYSGTSHNGPSHERTTSLLWTLAVAPNEITTELVFNQPPTSGRFLIPDSGQAVCSQLTNFVQQCLLYYGQKGKHTYFSCRNLILEEHENLNIEAEKQRRRRRHRHPWVLMPDGPAAPSVFNATDRTSGPVTCSYITRWGSHCRESEETIVDRSTDLASVSVVHRCRSLLLSFSICYLGILCLEGAINCILAQTSHQRTTSEKRTKALLPKCPLFGGSTV